MARLDSVPNCLVDFPEAQGAGVCNISEASKILVPPCETGHEAGAQKRSFFVKYSAFLDPRPKIGFGTSKRH